MSRSTVISLITFSILALFLSLSGAQADVTCSGVVSAVSINSTISTNCLTNSTLYNYVSCLHNNTIQLFQYTKSQCGFIVWPIKTKGTNYFCPSGLGYATKSNGSFIGSATMGFVYPLSTLKYTINNPSSLTLNLQPFSDATTCSITYQLSGATSAFYNGMTNGAL